MDDWKEKPFGIVAVVIPVVALTSTLIIALGARELLTLYPNSFACDTTEERSCAVSRNISLPHKVCVHSLIVRIVCKNI